MNKFIRFAVALLAFVITFAVLAALVAAGFAALRGQFQDTQAHIAPALLIFLGLSADILKWGLSIYAAVQAYNRLAPKKDEQPVPTP